jgi:hypothetical protein
MQAYDRKDRSQFPNARAGCRWVDVVLDQEGIQRVRKGPLSSHFLDNPETLRPIIGHRTL